MSQDWCSNTGRVQTLMLGSRSRLTECGLPADDDGGARMSENALPQQEQRKECYQCHQCRGHRAVAERRLVSLREQRSWQRRRGWSSTLAHARGGSGELWQVETQCKLKSARQRRHSVARLQ